ncbi:MAG: nucleoside triphosphate pyrophosphatase [Phycisphaeraceae bacterium]
MNSAPPLILASQSPRRAQLLREAGVAFEQRSPPYEDPDQPPEQLDPDTAEAYALSLAYAKANSLSATLRRSGLVLAADTICIDARGGLIGKPRDAAHARAILDSFIDAEHRVLTAVALLQVAGRGEPAQPLDSFADSAVVRFGQLDREILEAYLDTGDWRGKAGAYNLFDRQAAGWPIDVTGDPTTVVGLPMQRLKRLLQTTV